MKRLVAGLALALSALAAPAALAGKLAVIIANETYLAYPSPSGAKAVLAVAAPLEEAGFETVVVRDMTAAMLAGDMSDLARRIAEADSVIMVTAGYYAATGGASWLVATDADQPDIITIGQQGLAMAALYGLAESKSGAVILAVAQPESWPRIGWQLGRGFRPGEVPQGVTLLTGEPAAVAKHLPKFLDPGRAIGEVALDIPTSEARVLGFRPMSQAFLPGDGTVDAERRAWQSASNDDTIEAYLDYLRHHPDGRFADQAAARVEALDLSPAERAAKAEADLGLTRDRRRQLQRYLTMLGHDTQGADGVFGPRTRTAVRAWQASIGADQTGFLTGNQVSRLERDGAVRAEELRLEEAAKQAVREEADRAFWQETGAGATEAGIERYLAHYPDGLFVDAARRRLDEIAQQDGRVAREQERRDWEHAVSLGTLEAFQSYLRTYPNGQFADEALARVRGLSGGAWAAPQEVADARLREERMQLGPVRRKMIERQLATWGLDPGVVDGTFDDRSRAALRRFQQSNGLPPTGYVTEEAMILLLAGALLPLR